MGPPGPCSAPLCPDEATGMATEDTVIGGGLAGCEAAWQLERRIAATDADIDRLVYDLYGLTEDEIAIVEGRSAPVRPLRRSAHGRCE